MQPLKERFSSGAARFRYLPAPPGTHFPLSGELTGPRLIQDIVSTLLRAILREAARYVIYRSAGRTNYLLVVLVVRVPGTVDQVRKGP